MMKKTNLLTALASVFLLLSCETDNYESGDGKYSMLRADFSVAYTNASGLVTHVITDNGDDITLKTPYESKWANVPDSLYRSIVYFEKVEIGQGSILSMTQVGVPTIRPASSAKEVKTDPVKLESAWRSRNDSYINLGLNLLTGQQDGDKGQQVIGMLCDTLLQHDNGRKHLRLRLYHDQNKVPEYYTARTFISIPLQGNPYHLNTGDTVSIAINTYDDGEIERQFIY